MKTVKCRIKLIEDVLGTLPANDNIYREFIGSKAPDASTVEDEVANVGVDEVVEKGKTVFPKEGGKPFVYDYQIKGFFKSAAQELTKVKGMKTASLKAYKKKIDLAVFPSPRKIFFENMPGPITECQRPLRAQTMQGERVSLAISESIPAGSELEFSVVLLDDDYVDMLKEWLTYGLYNGLLQWRNSGKGRFKVLNWEVSDFAYGDEL